MEVTKANAIISLIADSLLIIEVVSVFVMICVARIKIKVQEVTYIFCLILLGVITLFSIPDELCVSYVPELCFENPCIPRHPQRAGKFCPINDDIICGEGTNYVYYSYKLCVALFVDFVLLMRASSICEYEKTQICLGFAITAFHFFAELVFMCLSCDIRMIHEGCGDLLGFQIAQIAVSVIPPLILVSVEVHGLCLQAKTKKYFTDDELDEDQFSYRDHVDGERNECVDQLMDAANIEGVEFGSGRVCYSERLNDE